LIVNHIHFAQRDSFDVCIPRKFPGRNLLSQFLDKAVPFAAIGTLTDPSR